MRIKPTIFKFLILLCSTFTTAAVFGQTTYTWTGAADGPNLATAGNWDPNGQPSGASQDTAQWDGLTTTNLLISYGSTGLPGTGFGTSGINLILTPNQTNSVTIISPVAQSAAVGVNGITNDSASAAFILGDDTANRVNIVGRPAGAVHSFFNNAATPVTINASVRWQAGGGNAYTLDFGGPGNWIVNNYLRNDNNSGATTIQVDGPGTMTWTAAGVAGNSAIGPVNITGGVLVLGSSGLLAGQAIANDATLQFDAASQSQTLSGVISGSGLLNVANGTLTLSGANTYNGNTVLSGGELVVSSAENAGASGPLGVDGTILFNGGTLGFSINNTFDYSSRFSTAANQEYSFDTAGQSVTFTNGLSSSGGTLTKVGSGTLTLSGASSYTGLTTISSGELVFDGAKSGTGDIIVGDGAALGITATSTQVTPGTLTVGTSAGATLGFNNVNSTTTAPLAASALSSAGTVTININSGTFAVGQSYPLLTWTSGSAPSASLGTLNGFVGNLSLSGNTLLLNITDIAYVWTGANNGNWDTSTANNWMLSGSPATFTNGSPVLFDDTASGTTNVTVNSIVQPASVTVNNNRLIYTITSSSGNDIRGSTGLTKSGSGMLTLSGGANGYTGVTTISGGTLAAGALANGHSPSDIGAADSSATNLVLNGGTLQYIGGAANIDRLFTLGTAGGAIDASGSGALNLNNADSVALSGTGPRTLTLTGTNTLNNTLAAALGDNGGATSLTKSGAGAWVLTGTNTYSGVTTIASGMLQIGDGSASGAIGGGSIANNGTLDFNLNSSLTVGTISGTGSITNDGSGTVILPGNNTYTGGTTINAGTLQIGSGADTGSLDNNNVIVDNGTLIFNSTGDSTLGAGGVGSISGTGQLIKRGSGLLKLLGNNTYTGGTTIDDGARLQVCEGNQGAIASPVITNNGSLIMVRQDNAVFTYAGNIVGTGSLTKDVNNPNPGDVTLTGTNTYTGGTIIRGGGIVLGDGATPGAGSLVGDVIFTNSLVNDTARTLTFNHPDDYTFSGNIVGAVVLGQGGAVAANAGSVTHQGPGTLTLTGTNTYPAGTSITQGTLEVGAGGTSGSIGTGTVTDNGTLVFNRSDSVTFSNIITGAGFLVQQGSGTTTLSAANTYTGNTTVSNGTLVINGDNSLTGSTFVYGGTLGGTGTLAGPVTLEAGTTLAPGPSVGTLTINNSLSIGGNVAIEVNKSLSQSNDLVVVASGMLINTGTGTLTVANLGPALAVGDKFTLFSQPMQNGAALTITGAGATWNNNLATDGSISVASVSPVTSPPLNFTTTAGGLQFSWTGGFKLQAQTNSLSPANWADYPGGATSPITVPIDTTKGSVFFRLVSTP